MHRCSSTLRNSSGFFDLRICLFRRRYLFGFQLQTYTEKCIVIVSSRIVITGLNFHDQRQMTLKLTKLLKTAEHIKNK